MKKSIQISQQLSSLSPSEQQAFRAFLESPYFNRQERLLRLGNFLLEFPHENHPKEILFPLVIPPGQAPKDQILYDACSQLQKLLHRFLAQRAYEEQPSLQTELLLQSLAQQQNEKAFLRQRKKARQKAAKHPYRDLIFFEQEFRLSRLSAVFEAGLQRRDPNRELENSVRYLDLFYWTARLKYSCELLNRSQILNQPVEDELYAPLDAWLKESPSIYLEEKSVQGYLLIYQALQAPGDEAHFLRWTTWLRQHYERFSPEEARDMYHYAQNYCIRRINEGKSIYLNHLFSLFKQLVETELVLINGYMDHRQLKNMVTVGIRLGAYQWVDDFLHSARAQLLPAYQSDAYQFNLASLRYAQGQHSKALQLLQKVEFRDVFYELSGRSLLLKIYYETDEDMGLEFLLETFRLYLQRNQAISSVQRKVHLNLLRFSRKMHRLRQRKNLLKPEQFSERLQKLQTQIATAQDTANRSWLLQQVERLGNL